jgi:hypothetical protein
MWTQVEAKIDGEAVTIAQKGERFTVLQEVPLGATIIADGKTYAVASVENIANRSEAWLVSTIEVVNVKSTTRRTED